MQRAFTKMHGLGNDFVVMEVATPEAVPAPDEIRRLADRRTGVGFDQALVLLPPRTSDTHAYYRVFNADGSEVEQCGNGARCLALYLGSRFARGDGSVHLDSPGGRVEARLLEDGLVSVAMGVPDFAPAALPFATDNPLADRHCIDLPAGPVEFAVVSLGNPHAVLIVPDVATAPVDSVGPALENHARFPRRVNVGFMEIVDPQHVRLRVHERGAGETPACGTGACAAVAVGRRAGLLDAEVEVEVPGGRLRVKWEGPGEPVWLTGPAERSYEGQVSLAEPAPGVHG
jgi:diaminopimelate epimerase